MANYGFPPTMQRLAVLTACGVALAAWTAISAAPAQRPRPAPAPVPAPAAAPVPSAAPVSEPVPVSAPAPAVAQNETWAVAVPRRGALLDDVGTFVRPSNAERLAALKTLLSSHGLKSTSFTFENDGLARDARPRGENVVADLGTGRRDIIVSAHVDAVRLADESLSGGAVDNAAGVVVIERVAEMLARTRLRHRVRFVFFDMEELGLVGSKHFVDAADTTRIAAAVNVDVAGYGDTIAYGPTASGRAGFLAPLLQQRCAAVQVSCLPFEQYPASDDLSFQAAGIPALSLAVVPAVEAHQIWLLSNGGANSGLAPGFLPRVLTIIHTPGDQMDKLEPDAMVLACRVLRDLVLQIDARR